jgi:hypothetical protein
MDETRIYRAFDDDDDWTIPDDEREFEAASRDEVPFHIPRD